MSEVGCFFCPRTPRENEAPYVILIFFVCIGLLPRSRRLSAQAYLNSRRRASHFPPLFHEHSGIRRYFPQLTPSRLGISIAPQVRVPLFQGPQINPIVEAPREAPFVGTCGPAPHSHEFVATNRNPFCSSPIIRLPRNVQLPNYPAGAFYTLFSVFGFICTSPWCTLTEGKRNRSGTSLPISPFLSDPIPLVSPP